MLASGRDSSCELAMVQEEYIQVSKKIYRAMIESYDDDEATENAKREWLDDIRGGEHALPAEKFKDAIFELADLWTSGIDAVEYSVFLRHLFRQITEGQPPDQYLWLPTERIVHGGYTSPRKLRADEPPRDDGSSSRDEIDFLRLDAANNVAEESHRLRPYEPDHLYVPPDSEEGEHLAAMRDALRSPLRGGRRGGVSDDAEATGAAVEHHARQRPTSSPGRRTPKPPATSQPHAHPYRPFRRASINADAPPSTAPSDPSRNPFEFADAEWHGATWHRPRSSAGGSRDGLSNSGSLSNSPSAATLSAAALANALAARAKFTTAAHDSIRAPPTAGMAANGLSGGVTTARGEEHGVQPIHHRMCNGMPPHGRRVSVPNPLVASSRIPDARNGRLNAPVMMATMATTHLQLAIENRDRAPTVYVPPARRQPLGFVRPNGHPAQSRGMIAKELKRAMRAPRGAGLGAAAVSRMNTLRRASNPSNEDLLQPAPPATATGAMPARTMGKWMQQPARGGAPGGSATMLPPIAGAAAMPLGGAPHSSWESTVTSISNMR